MNLGSLLLELGSLVQEAAEVSSDGDDQKERARDVEDAVSTSADGIGGSGSGIATIPAHHSMPVNANAGAQPGAVRLMDLPPELIAAAAAAAGIAALPAIAATCKQLRDTAQSEEVSERLARSCYPE